MQCIAAALMAAVSSAVLHKPLGKALALNAISTDQRGDEELRKPGKGEENRCSRKPRTYNLTLLLQCNREA
jgi:hypothetical protein